MTRMGKIYTDLQTEMPDNIRVIRSTRVLVLPVRPYYLSVVQVVSPPGGSNNVADFPFGQRGGRGVIKATFA